MTFEETQEQFRSFLDEENDLFGPPKNDDFFNEIDDEAPFGKSGGLFSSKKKGNSLFDEPEEVCYQNGIQLTL